MGKVYLAEHVEIGKRVALKVLHPSYSRMPDLVERFRREARAASKIGHPNIVDVTDSGTTADGSVYFVMEYLEGVELGSVIEREGALDVARGLKITGQICRALSAARHAWHNSYSFSVLAWRHTELSVEGRRLAAPSLASSWSFPAPSEYSPLRRCGMPQANSTTSSPR